MASEFNEEITLRMLERAREHAVGLGAKVTYVCKVPGAFDMPIIIQALLEKDDVDAVATVGAVVKGETGHDLVVAENAAAMIAELSLKYRKPVSLGVAGPGMTWDQGMARVDEYARRSVEAALKLARRLKDLGKARRRGTVVID